jgi:anthranilate phosphoribosyltransferase
MSDIKNFLKKLVDGKSLSFDEAKKCAELIISGSISQTLTSAILIALRMKGETPEEIAGFAYAMRESAIKPEIPPDIKPIDTCGTGGDGIGTFNASTCSAIILASLGIPVAKHGNRAVSSQIGSADILEKIGVKIEVKPEDVPEELRTKNFVFLFAPLYHPAMKNVAPVRRELGIRTIFNLLGPLTNPAGVRRQIIGVFSPDYAEKLADATREFEPEKVLIFSGEIREGKFIDEISPSGRTLFFYVEGRKKESFSLDVRDILKKPVPPEKIQYSNNSADEFLSVLEGKAEEELIDFVALNTGAGLLIYDKAKDLKEGYEKAKEFILSGKAKKFYEEKLKQKLLS